MASVTAVALLVAGGGGALADGTSPDPAVPTVPVIVDGGGAAAAAAITAVGGALGQHIDADDGWTGSVPATAVAQLKAALPTVLVTVDTPVSPPAAPAVDASLSTSLADVAHLVGADVLQQQGLTGKGVDVALIDTGVSPVPGLNDPGKVVNGPDLSFDSQSPATQYLDGYGHGTAMAGIIAANDPASGVRGLAPDARVLNVKAGSANGTVDISQIVAAVDWVVQHRNDNGLNVRVLNLSLGFENHQRAALDPLVHAVDNAWRNGIAVVASVGNDGKKDGTVASPATDPNVIAVGAVDTAGSLNPVDAVMADFSSQGGGARTPDLVAPGARIVTLRTPGSYLDVNYPAARRGDTLFRGSGTSEAAAVVSGSAALLLQQRPSLTPDQLKALLLGTATPMDAKKSIAGKGLLSVGAAASAATPLKTQVLKKVTGTGSLEKARGDAHLVMNGVVLQGDKDVFGNAYDSARMAQVRTAGASWSGGSWNGASWSGASWSGASWSGASWSGASWSGASWSGASWSGASWSGASWSGASWSGASWSGTSWSGASWSGASWSGASWSGASWSGSTWYGNAWA